MRALVVGGAGFLGSTVVDRLLEDGHEVDVLDDLSTGTLANLAAARAVRGAPLKIHQADVCDEGVSGLIARRRPEVIFHLALPVAATGGTASAEGDRPAQALTSAAVGTLRVLQGALAVAGAERPKVVVALAAGDIYRPLGPKEAAITEARPIEPRSAAGVGTTTALELLRWHREVHAVEFTALALGNLYGPRQRAGAEPGTGPLVAELTAAAAHGGRLAIVHGDGEQARDLLAVEDAADAVVRAGERGSGLVINVSSGAEVTVRDLLAAIAEARGGEALVVERAPERSDDLRRLALDPGRARLHLGWRPTTALADGLAATLAWQQDQLPPPESGPDPAAM